MKNDTQTEENVVITRTEYESLKQQIAWLMEQLKLSKRCQFGVSSEKSEYNQVSIWDEAEPANTEPDTEEVKAYQRKKSRHAADRLPPDLPVEIVGHELSEDERVCPDCGGALHAMGHERTKNRGSPRRRDNGAGTARTRQAGAEQELHVALPDKRRCQVSDCVI